MTSSITNQCRAWRTRIAIESSLGRNYVHQYHYQPCGTPSASAVSLLFKVARNGHSTPNPLTFSGSFRVYAADLYSAFDVLGRFHVSIHSARPLACEGTVPILHLIRLAWYYLITDTYAALGCDRPSRVSVTVIACGGVCEWVYSVLRSIY